MKTSLLYAVPFLLLACGGAAEPAPVELPPNVDVHVEIGTCPGYERVELAAGECVNLTDLPVIVGACWSKPEIVGCVAGPRVVLVPGGAGAIVQTGASCNKCGS